MTPERVYVLVAVDKDAVVNAAPFVRVVLSTSLDEDQFAVADVTDLVVSRITGFTGESRLRSKLLERLS